MRLRLAALAGAIAVAVTLPLAVARAESPLLIEARKSYQAGRHEQAAKAATDALAAGLAPAETARAYYLRALALSASEKNAQAIADFTSAIWLGQLTAEEKADAEARRAAAYGAVGVGGNRTQAVTGSAGAVPAPSGSTPPVAAVVASNQQAVAARPSPAPAPASPAAQPAIAAGNSQGGWSLEPPQTVPATARPARAVQRRVTESQAGSSLDERGWASSAFTRPSAPAAQEAPAAQSAPAPTSIPLIAAAPAASAAQANPAAPPVAAASGTQPLALRPQGAATNVAGGATAPAAVPVAGAPQSGAAGSTATAGGWRTTPAASNDGLGSFLSDGFAALFGGGGTAPSGPEQTGAFGSGVVTATERAAGAFDREELDAGPSRRQRLRTAAVESAGGSRAATAGWQVEVPRGAAGAASTTPALPPQPAATRTVQPSISPGATGSAPNIAASVAPAARPLASAPAARSAPATTPQSFETMVLAALEPSDGNSSGAVTAPSPAPFGMRDETGIIGAVQPGAPRRTRVPSTGPAASGRTGTTPVALAPSIFSAGSGAPASAAPSIANANGGGRATGAGGGASNWTAQTVAAPTAARVPAASGQSPVTAPKVPAEARAPAAPAPQAPAPQGTILGMLTNLFTPTSTGAEVGAPAPGRDDNAASSPWGSDRDGGLVEAAPSQARVAASRRQTITSSDGSWSGSVATVAPGGPAAPASTTREPAATAVAARPAVAAPPPPLQFASLAPAGAPTRSRAAAGQAKPAAAQAGAFSLQVAAVRSEADARALAARLMVQHQAVIGSYEASIEETVLGNMGTFFRVRVGPFASEQESLSVCQKLRRSQIDCFLVR